MRTASILRQRGKKNERPDLDQGWIRARLDEPDPRERQIIKWAALRFM
jgi:hypothetical protein